MRSCPVESVFATKTAGGLLFIHQSGKPGQVLTGAASLRTTDVYGVARVEKRNGKLEWDGVHPVARALRLIDGSLFRSYEKKEVRAGQAHTVMMSLEKSKRIVSSFPSVSLRTLVSSTLPTTAPSQPTSLKISMILWEFSGGHAKTNPHP